MGTYEVLTRRPVPFLAFLDGRLDEGVPAREFGNDPGGKSG